MKLNETYVDSLSNDEVRELLEKLIESLQLAEDDGVFGSDSWHGFLDIEV